VAKAVLVREAFNGKHTVGTTANVEVVSVITVIFTRWKVVGRILRDGGVTIVSRHCCGKLGQPTSGNDRLLEGAFAATAAGEHIENDLSALTVAHHEPVAQTILGGVLQTSATVFVTAAAFVAVHAGVPHGTADVFNVDLAGLVQIAPTLGGGVIFHV